MRNLRNAFAALALFILFSNNTGLGIETYGHESGGGDAIAGEFVFRAHRIHDFLKQKQIILNPSELTAFKLSVDDTWVEVVNDALYDPHGLHVMALTVPDPERPDKMMIVLNRPAWTEALISNIGVYRLIFHEYLRVIGLDDDHYKLSKNLDIHPGDISDPYANPYAKNLHFEQTPTAGEFPSGWGGWLNGFEIVSDSSSYHSGHWSGRISATLGKGKFSTLTQCISAAPFIGKEMGYSGYLKAGNITQGWAGLWARVDGTKGEVLAFDNMQDRPVFGTSNWNQYAIQLYVSKSASRICFGALLSGFGTLWIDDLDIK